MEGGGGGLDGAEMFCTKQMLHLKSMFCVTISIFDRGSKYVPILNAIQIETNLEMFRLPTFSIQLVGSPQCAKVYWSRCWDFRGFRTWRRSKVFFGVDEGLNFQPSLMGTYFHHWILPGWHEKYLFEQGAGKTLEWVSSEHGNPQNIQITNSEKNICNFMKRSATPLC